MAAAIFKMQLCGLNKFNIMSDDQIIEQLEPSSEETPQVRSQILYTDCREIYIVRGEELLPSSTIPISGDRIVIYRRVNGKSSIEDYPAATLISRGSTWGPAEDFSVSYGDRIFSYDPSTGISEIAIYSPPSDPTPIDEKLFGAEEWLANQGYSSVRLVTLLDLENQLASILGNSPKLTAVRAWINGILAAFIQTPAPKNDWPSAPFSFEETTAEAFAALLQ
jgi:hypothetical protein